MYVVVNTIGAHQLILGVQKRAMCLLLFGILVSKVYAGAGPPPVITVQPLDQTVQEGDSVSFTVTATSATLITYKWYFNENLVNGYGQGTATITITNTQAVHAGVYSVEVKNAGGKTMSSNAVLTVVSAPFKYTSASMTTNGFTMALSGPSGSNYVILASTNLKDWTPIFTNAAPAGRMTFTDTTATNRSSRFYKAMLR
jgi:large repetitive protein